MLRTNVNLKLALIILMISVIGVVYLIGKEVRLTQEEIKDLNQKEANISESLLKELQRERVLYLIDEGDDKINSYQTIPSQDSTVFSLLKALAEKEDFKIEFKIYSGIGVFIESIDGIRNGTDNKYWQYWINGELPMVAADKREVKGGDRIEWKFAPSPF